MPRKRSTKPRRRPVQERAQVTWDAILTAAAQVLFQEGYERASTNRIAKVAGVSIGTLYQYFPNKEALMEALLDRHQVEAVGLLQETLAQIQTATLPEATRMMLSVQIKLHRINPELHRVMLEHRPADRSFEQVWKISRQIQVQIRNYLALHKDLLKVQDLDLAAFMVVTAAEALIHAAVVDRSELVEDDTLLDELTLMILRYVLKDPP